MGTEPETLKFGPMWIRKLSHCPYGSMRNSNDDLSEITHESAILSLGAEIGENRLFLSSENSNGSGHDGSEGLGFENNELPVWLPSLPYSVDLISGSNRILSLSGFNQEDFEDRFLRAACRNRNTNFGIPEDVGEDKQSHISSESFTWREAFNAPDAGNSWLRVPAPAVTLDSAFVIDSSRQKPLDSVPSPADGQGSSLSMHLKEDLSQSVPSNTIDSNCFNVLDDPPVDSSLILNANVTNLSSEVEGFPAKFQTLSSESLHVSALSKSVTSTLSPQSFGTCCVSRSIEKPLTAAEVLSNSRNHQTQVWSKSLSPAVLSSEVSSSVVCSETTGIDVSSLLSRDVSNNPLTSDGSVANVEGLGSNMPYYHATSVLTKQQSIPSDERRLHQPDGADQPDEHLWLYEDPQGRTQGSFSDAQMNDWLSAGIYFTPVLRIRRKCDSAYSTLADYTCLFGRNPFTPGSRVSPIHGGITPGILAMGGRSPSRLSPLEHSEPTDHLSSYDEMTYSGAHTSVARSTVNPIISGGMETLHSVHQSCQSDYSTKLSSGLPSAALRGNFAAAEGHHLSVPKTAVSGMCANSSLPVLQPHQQIPSISLSQAITAMNVAGYSSNELDVHLSGTVRPAITSASTFMALASLISVNPGLTSLALSFAGQSQTGSCIDWATVALTPGFLAALAQYLNVHPQGSGHSSNSPMQQLAETAQLAAQLAAMASSHSPIEPAQALALAQLVRSQANPSFSPHWIAHAKKDTNVDSGRDPSLDTTGRLTEQGVGEDSVRSPLSSGNPPGAILESDSQLHWPPPSHTGGLRTASRAGDGWLSSKTLLPSPNCDSLVLPPDRTRDGPSNSIGVPSRQHHKGTTNSGPQPASSRSKNKNRQESNVVDPDRRINATAMLRHPPGCSSRVNPNSNSQLDEPINTALCTGSHVSTNRQWVNKIKPVSKSTNIQSPLKTGTCQPNTTELKSSATTISQSSCSTQSETDRTADEELCRLTQWCQTRLDSIPMREKVDIPTVVELIATLDAPYEVERMIQAVLGESTRTSAFVKEFLDQRRPFWQLHRARRENDCAAKTVSPADSSNGNGPRSTDKKKRTGGCHENNGQGTHRLDAGAQVNIVGTAWTKTVPTSSDHGLDNQWHHIKPKGNHNRKVKKDKT